MKKLISLVVLLALCLSVFAACGAKEASDLDNAAEYLRSMYKDSPVTTPSDYNVVGVVVVGTKEFPITWTTDAESIKVVPNDDKFVTIDVDEKNPEVVTYKLTASLTDGKDTKTLEFAHEVPAAMLIGPDSSYGDIVGYAYKLEESMAFETAYRLFGEIVKIDTPYSPDYGNITVTIAVEGCEDQPIQCYRLKGDGADKLAVGDKITVEGIIKNYKGTIEFDSGCVLVGMGEHKSYSLLLDAAYALEDGMALEGIYTAEGVVKSIDTAYSADYGNITVTIVCDGDEDRPLQCYRLQGEGVDKIAVGDKITVTGAIKNYKGTIEFDAKCELNARVAG